MINYNDTEIAFRSKSKWDLKKAYFLFKLIGNAKLNKISSSLTRFALRYRLPIAWAVKPTIYKHFVGGVSIKKCTSAVETLAKYNVKSILDYSVEGGEKVEDFTKALEETILTIINARKNSDIPFAVFKPTAFAPSDILEKASKSMASLNSSEKLELNEFEQRIEKLCSTAFANDTPLLIDAEHSYYQNIIDTVVTNNQKKYNQKKAIVFNTYQMYRHDRLEKLKDDYQSAMKYGYFLGAKFVRGAYMEIERERADHMNYQDPIQPNKKSTDRDYNDALQFCVEHIDRISIFNGTHNEYSSTYLTDLMQEHGIENNDNRCYFSQLYGMSDNISFNLADNGYNVAKYLPYGPVKSVLPYLIRRAEENTSIAGQTSREFNLIHSELRRRKKK